MAAKHLEWLLAYEDNLLGNLGSVPDPESPAGVALVYEYCNGGTLEGRLAERIREGKALSYDEVLDCGRQLARGLHLMHASNLLHRDLAPRNIFLVLKETEMQYKIGNPAFCD